MLVVFTNEANGAGAKGPQMMQVILEPYAPHDCTLAGYANGVCI